ncbi:MAG TPA: hypothetical protein VIG33_16770 [Pseudobdellovibrionaceae bacterium]|jgi:hypothetical protein
MNEMNAMQKNLLILNSQAKALGTVELFLRNAKRCGIGGGKI